MEDGPKVNALAIVSLILGLAAVFLILIGMFVEDAVLLCIPGAIVGPIAGIVGSVASRQIRRSEGSQEGSEIALVGIVIGVFSFLLLVAYLVCSWVFFPSCQWPIGFIRGSGLFML